MKQVEKLPELASDFFFHSDEILTVLPQRIVKMKVLHQKKYRQVIVPETHIKVCNQEKNKKTYFIGGLSYHLNNGKAFPLAHIYSQSGLLCLGSLFVPRVISAHQLSASIDTLFLHNDRNIRHGNPSLVVNNGKRQQIIDVLQDNALHWDDNSLKYEDWIEYDTIWNLTADILEQKEKIEAMGIVNKIFSILFNKKGC